MSVTYGKPARIDETSFRLTWTSDVTAPVPFRVYVDRILVTSFDSTDGYGEWIFTVGAGASPFVEVLDKACSVPALAFPGRAIIHWLSVTGAKQYRVEEYVSAVWTLRNTLADNGEPAFSWQSRWLEDITTHQFRVIAVDTAGNQGTALSFSTLMVRHPDVPNVTYTYNGSATPTLTIAAG